MNTNRYCVIMCGGVGSRFWPYSRSRKPKQFIDFFGTGRSLLQMSVDRIRDIVPLQNIYMVTNAQYAGLIAEQLPELSSDQILLEPARRNTAPCIAWAAYHIIARDPEARIMVAPSDHLVLRTDEFQRCVEKAFRFIEINDALVTMGIKPNRPETGYGYIQVGEQTGDDFSSVKTFTEKPDEQLAQVFVDSGEFFWNSGMFFWRASTIVSGLREYAPDIAQIFDQGEGVFGTADEAAFIAENYAACRNISIDFALMEKAPNVYVECVDFGWSDLGTWGSLYDNQPKGDGDNVTRNTPTLLINSHRNVVATDNDKLVVASGLDDYIIADTADALLIVPKAEEQKIRNYVNEVRARFGEKYL